jgi:hypothetical protein
MPRRTSTPTPARTSLSVALAVLVALLAGLVTAASAGASVQTGQAPTVTITFKACPPGGDESGPPAGCVETIDAPDHAVVTAAPDWVMPVSELERNADGSYALPHGWLGDAATGELGLVNFFPENFNYFTFEGVDTLTRWYGGVEPVAGATREVTVYFWDGPNGLITPAENRLEVNVLACDGAIDPTLDPSGCTPVTGDLPDLYVGTAPLRQVEMDDYLVRDGGTLTYAGLPAYTPAQVVVHRPLAGYGEVHVTGQAETVENDAATAFLLRGERRVIDVYFFAPDGSANVPAPTETPEPGAGTLRLMLLSCPAGVNPHDDPGRCTDTVGNDGSATVTFPETGERLPLTDFERDEAGAYLITGVRSSVTIGGVTSVDYDRLASDADEIDGPEVVYRVDPGETREGRLYYFDEE